MQESYCSLILYDDASLKLTTKIQEVMNPYKIHHIFPESQSIFNTPPCQCLLDRLDPRLLYHTDLFLPIFVDIHSYYHVVITISLFCMMDHAGHNQLLTHLCHPILFLAADFQSILMQF